MARVLTERECRKVERWAKVTKLGRIVSFFENLPREIRVPRPILLGSNNTSEIRVDGFSTTSRVISAIQNLDQPFNPNCVLQKTLLSKKREKFVGSPLTVVYDTLRKGLDEVCLLKGMGGCSDTIAKAHSIQKSGFKKYATADGHVYHFDPFGQPSRNDTLLWPERIGIKRATTFTGFCARHDSATFAPIETKPFVGSAEQRFLFHYRALAQAYYNRVHKMKVIEAAHADIVERFGAEQARWFTERLVLNAHDIRDITQIKTRSDLLLKENKFPEVASYVLTTKKIPDILTTDFFGPHKDFRGSKIQDGKSLNPLNWVSLTITIASDKGLILLCAEPTNPQFELLRVSLDNMPNSDKAMALATYTVCTLENFIMLPQWWESLCPNDQVAFVKAYNSRYFPRQLPSVCDWYFE